MTTPDKESEETGKVCECGDPGPHHCGPVDDVVARFREKFGAAVGDGASVKLTCGSDTMLISESEVQSFILGEIQAAREEERAAWAEREYKLLRDIERLVVERDALRTDLTN